MLNDGPDILTGPHKQTVGAKIHGPNLALGGNPIKRVCGWNPLPPRTFNRYNNRCGMRQMLQQLKTVLIPAAGQGTRLLPLTKTTPKELLPVYDRPVLQFAVDEAIAAGAERIVIVINPSKTVIRDYLAHDDAFSRLLQGNGKSGLVARLSAVRLPDNVEVLYAIQEEPLGLGHAVGCCRDLVLPGPIGVILPDDVILGEPCLTEMAKAYAGGHMVAALDVEPSETCKYGIFIPIGPVHQRCMQVAGMVEKPSPGQAPSTLAAVGRYILDPVILSTLATTQPGSGNEVQLTDGIARDAAAIGLTAFRFSGSRYDCGSLDGLLEAGMARYDIVRNRRTLLAERSSDTRTLRIATN